MAIFSFPTGCVTAIPWSFSAFGKRFTILILIPGEFATIKSQAGLNSYKLSVKEWVEKTKAIGLRASAGRYPSGLPQSDRLRALNEIAITQMRTLLAAGSVKRLK